MIENLFDFEESSVEGKISGTNDFSIGKTLYIKYYG